MPIVQTDTQASAPPAPDGRTEVTNDPNAAVSTQWARVCSVDDIPPLGARVVRRSEGPNVAVFRTAADTYFALADRCPHRGGPLSQGIVYGDHVACPLHNMSIELGSGCAVAPDKGEVQRFDVKVEAGIVYVALPVDANADRYAYG